VELPRTGAPSVLQYTEHIPAYRSNYYNHIYSSLFPILKISHKSSPNSKKLVISRRMKRVGYVARMRETRNAYKVLVKKPEGKDHLVELSVEGRMKLKKS
jgi:hypothetical protein